MNLLIAKEKITSHSKKNVYAEIGDMLKLIDVSGHVGIYYNYYNKERFPCNITLVDTIDSRLYIRPIKTDGKKVKQKAPTNQLSLF